LTTKDEDGGLNAEVSNRLDELFGDDDSETSAMPVESPGGSDISRGPDTRGRKLAAADVGNDVDSDDANSPVKALKALVFSIDWEITDDIMVDFLKEIKRLAKKYRNDKVLSIFLKLHESLGKYIKAKKVRAHPDSIQLIASVYKNFEKVLLSTGITEVQKKKLLSSEVKKFKAFKQRVLLREEALEPAEVEKMDIRVIEEVVPELPVAEKAAPPISLPLESKEAVEYILSELKKTIKAEFHTLRQIIKNLGA
jgi:hypothetical protein